jgi:putative two-component system response regulator
MSNAATRRNRAAARRAAARTVGAGKSVARLPLETSNEFKRVLELASLVESATDAVIGVSREGVINSWGESAKLLFGYTRDEAVGRSITMLAPFDRADEPTTLIEQVLTGGRVHRLETERICKDGRSVNVLLSIAAIRGDGGSILGAVGVYRDLTGQRRAEAELHETERRYHSLVEALDEGVVMQAPDGRVLASNKSAERVLGLSTQELAAGFPDRPSWSLVHEDGAPLRIADYPTIISMRTGEPQRGVIVGIEGAAPATRWISVNSNPLTRPNETEPYAAVASFSDVTDLRATLAELQAARVEDLERLALVAEYRDDDTNRHTERVGCTAELLARELGWDSERASTIRRAAPLHDLGKIGIPDEILLKPAALSPEEFEVIKTHTVIGGRILCQSGAPIMRMATEIALAHHERWDGGGYPMGLQMQEIPIAGRIVAVADAFDAMTHARPYKAASTIDYALAELQRCSGSQFDPQVVEAFMKLEHRGLVDSAA